MNIDEVTRQQLAQRMAEFVLRPNPLLDHLVRNAPPLKPPTFAERMRFRLQRVRDAWKVLLGRADISDE
jgi:hypothetical protein